MKLDGILHSVKPWLIPSDNENNIINEFVSWINFIINDW